MTPSSWPSWRTSAAYTAAPVTFSRASRRGPARVARVEAAGAGISNGGEDSHVGAAAAQMPGERLARSSSCVGASVPRSRRQRSWKAIASTTNPGVQ